MRSLERHIKRYLHERDWDRLLPGDVAKSIMIEAAELLELFQWENPTIDAVKKDRAKMVELKEELADVIIYCLELAVLLDLSTDTIVRRKLALVKKKYPAFAMRKTANGNNGAGALYYRIKKTHRKKMRL